jgi:hypothetical protein
MPLRDASQPLVEWAKEAFAHEVQTGFSRAKVFDAPVLQIVFLALQEFPAEELQRLAQILPAGQVADLRGTLSPEDAKLVEAVIAAKNRIYAARQTEIVEQMTKVLQKPVREEAEKIRRMAGGIFREIAEHWHYEIRKAEPAVWLLTISEKWGSISVPFDLHERIEFSYSIGIQSDQVSGLPGSDHYLGRLGLSGRSACKVTDAKTCAETFWKVAGLIRWQLDAYIRIMVSLAKPAVSAGQGAEAPVHRPPA